MAELRSGDGNVLWGLEGKGVAGRSFDALIVFESGDSKDNGGNRGTNVSVVVPCNDECDPCRSPSMWSGSGEGIRARGPNSG